MDTVRVIKDAILVCGSILCHNHKSKILYYHDICGKKSYRSLDSDVLMGTPLELFKKHLEVIKEEGYIIVPTITKEKGEVSIMLDDGFRGIWYNRHFFYDNGIKPTIFLAVDLIGREGFLKETEILELQRNGFIFQCHSWSHTSLVDKTSSQLQKELGESKQYLSDLLGKNVDEICLPIGYFSNSLLESLKAYGYKEVYSSIPGDYYNKIFNYMRTRNLCQFASPSEVKYILRGGNDIIKSRYLRQHYK